MDRWIAAFPWLTWLLAALVVAGITLFGLLFWWLQHPVDDNEHPPP